MNEDLLTILDRNKIQNHSLRGMLAGGAAFLCCGGPSANTHKLEKLNRRGCWSMAVNNMAGHHMFRPSAFICSDPPKKFSHGIWMDPGIMKFVPCPKMVGSRSNLRRKEDDGTFSAIPQVCDQPNVWGYGRRSWLKPDDSFFAETDAAWGNHHAGTIRTSEPKTVCTMLLALRLLRYLGATTIYLVGVDFRMAEDYGYCFGQGRDDGASFNNNAQFAVVSGWLEKMADSGVFDRAGLKIRNCSPGSSLEAFPFVSFENAVKNATNGIESPLDLAGWYEK